MPHGFRPLCIKGDHSDVMYLLNTGWIILFADEPQKVYDFNLLGLKLAEAVRLPVAVAFDGFFTSHQKRKCLVFEDDDTVTRYIGEKLSCDNPKISAFAGTGTGGAAGTLPYASVLDLAHPVSIGSYMNEPDVSLITATSSISPWKRQGRRCRNYLQNTPPSRTRALFLWCLPARGCRGAAFVLGSSYHTAMEAVDRLRKDGVKAGVITLYVLRPFPAKELRVLCHNASTILVADRQDSYGAGGGNMSLEIKAALSSLPHPPRILSRIYGLGGKDFFVEDALALFKAGALAGRPGVRLLRHYCRHGHFGCGRFRKDIFLKESGDGDLTPDSLYRRRSGFRHFRQS